MNVGCRADLEAACNPHPLHQRGDMEAAHLHGTSVPEHRSHCSIRLPAKGYSDVQLIELTHQGHIGGSGGTTLIIDASLDSAQASRAWPLRLNRCARSIIVLRSAIDRPCSSAPSKKSFSRVSCPIYRMQRGHVDLRYGRLLHPVRRRPRARLPAGAPSKCFDNGSDARRTARGEFRHRLFSENGRQRHLGLKSRAMSFGRTSSRHGSSSFTAMMPLVSRNVTYPTLFRFTQATSYPMLHLLLLDSFDKFDVGD